MKATQREIFGSFADSFKANVIGLIDSGGEFTYFEQGYRKLINNAVVQAAEKEEDTAGIIKSAETLAERGLTRVNIPQSGIIGDHYTRNIGVSFAMEFRHMLTQMTREMAEILAEETGATGYEISYHRGHRPTHTLGRRQFTFGEMEKSGANAMLSDYNCYHWKFPVIVGVTPPAYSVEELARLEAAELVRYEYRGKERTLYELTQTLRKYERNIARFTRRYEYYSTLYEETGRNGAKVEKAIAQLKREADRYLNLQEMIDRIIAGSYQAPPKPGNDGSLPPLPPIKQPDWNDEIDDNNNNLVNFLELLGFRESSNRYDVVSRHGYMGKYQFGSIALRDIGFYDNNNNWTEKAMEYGVWNQETFLNNPEAQESAIRMLLNNNWRYAANYGLLEYIGTIMNGILITESGLLAAAHLVGIGALNGAIKRGDLTSAWDGNNVTAKEYMELFGGYNIDEIK